jgi:hypothetical protein
VTAAEAQLWVVFDVGEKAEWPQASSADLRIDCLADLTAGLRSLGLLSSC